MTILEKAKKIREFCNYTNDNNCKGCELNNRYRCCILSIDQPTRFCRTAKDRHQIRLAEPLALAWSMDIIKDYCHVQDCTTCEYNHEKGKKRAEGYNYCDVRKVLPKHFVIEKPMDLILGGK